MAYHELIKSFAKIRGYMREFYVYGFRHRTDIDEKSARSYDNERRRVESWLGEYMRFGQDADGKRIYLSVDSRAIAHNPLYRAFKTKSFTDNDVMLHFYLLDLLSEDGGLTIREVINEMENHYLADFDADILDESTIRKKLKEYEQLGLVRKQKRGRGSIYMKAADDIDLESWRNAISFYSETDPLGVVGSYLLDRFDNIKDIFRYKHHHIMKALDSEILYVLFEAVSSRSELKLTMLKSRKSMTVIPYRIYISTQYGRQYLFAWNLAERQFCTCRLDHILHAAVGKKTEEWDERYPQMRETAAHMWGAAVSNSNALYHMEFDVHAETYEPYVAERLIREKRCGTVEKTDDVTWRFSADVCNPREMLPWIRTFTGRIQNFSCDDPKVEERFWGDMEALYRLYDIKDEEKSSDMASDLEGDEGHAVP